jgi:hypothetical protein
MRESRSCEQQALQIVAYGTATCASLGHNLGSCLSAMISKPDESDRRSGLIIFAL